MALLGLVVLLLQQFDLSCRLFSSFCLKSRHFFVFFYYLVQSLTKLHMKTDRFHRFHFEIITALLIISLPFCLYFHVFFKDNTESLYFMGITLNHGFNNNEIFIWFVLKKSIAVILFFTWYFTTRFWWRTILLITLLPYLYALIFLFTVGGDLTSDFSSKYLIPFAIIIALLSTVYKLNKNNSINNRSYDEYIISINPAKYHKEIKSHLKELRRYEHRLNYFSYLKNLLITQTAIEKRLENRMNIKTHNSLVNSFEVLICIVLFTMPFLYYFHNLIPDNIQRISYLFFTIDNNGFTDLSTAVWFLSDILCLVIPVSIWFITERKWWRYAILSPIILSCYQIWEAFFNSSGFVDELGYLKSLPLIFLITVILFIFSYFVRYNYKILDIYDQLAIEIEGLFNFFKKEDIALSSLETEFAALRDYKSNKKNKHTLNQLFRLREDLIYKIEGLKDVTE